VLPVHIEISSPSSLHMKQVEEGLLSALRNIVSIISVKDLPENLSDDQRDRVAFLLKELQAVIVGAQLVRSIRLLTYVPTREVLQSLGARLTSGELAAIFQQLFCCLSGVDDLAVDLSVKVEDLQECKDQLGFIGMAAVLYMVPLKVYGCNVVVFRIFSLFFENFCLLKLGLVVVSHCYKLHEIQQILNFLWLMFSFLVVIVNV